MSVYGTRLSLEGDERWRVLRVRAAGPGRLVLNAVRTRPDRLAAALDDLTPVARLGTVIHENPRALPRAFLAGGLERAPSDSLAERLHRPDFEPRLAVLVEELPTDLRSGPAGGTVEGEVELVEQRPERIVADVRADTGAFLVLTDTWFPGWRARVDEREVPILRAYGALRAVPVPAGSSRVTFEYAPRSFAMGATASVLGVLLAAALPLLAWLRGLARRRRRERK
jgi:hypothetical protein